MQADITFDTADLERVLRRYEMKAKNLPMDLVGQMLVNAAEEMFETEGAAGSKGTWQPLSEQTILRRPNRAGGQLLQDTGQTANIQVIGVSGHSVAVGSPTAWSGWHLTGTQHMPERDFFAFRFDRLLDDIGDLLLQEVQR